MSEVEAEQFLELLCDGLPADAVPLVKACLYELTICCAPAAQGVMVRNVEATDHLPEAVLVYLVMADGVEASGGMNVAAALWSMVDRHGGEVNCMVCGRPSAATLDWSAEIEEVVNGLCWRALDTDACLFRPTCMQRPELHPVA
jgi:hypothetical protein